MFCVGTASDENLAWTGVACLTCCFVRSILHVATVEVHLVCAARVLIIPPAGEHLYAPVGII